MSTTLFSSAHGEGLNRITSKEIPTQTRHVRRLIHWSIEVSEFDIKYYLRVAIKGQLVIDFVDEFIIGEEEQECESECPKCCI
jgi:hypothetical protein